MINVGTLVNTDPKLKGVLEHPNGAFDKAELAELAGDYSAGSGGFNNALSRLNTLGLIQRVQGRIMLNPDVINL